MVKAIKQVVTVGEGGRIEIPQSELPPGSTAEVIVLATNPKPKKKRRGRITDYFGTVKGNFKTGAEADAFLSAERDAWDE